MNLGILFGLAALAVWSHVSVMLAGFALGDVYGYMPLRFLTTEVAGRLAVWETGQDQQRSAGGS